MFVACEIFFHSLQLTSDNFKYFWKISTCQFKLIGSGNCNHFILSFCWEIKEPNIKHKLLLLDSCKMYSFSFWTFFFKIKKVSFLSLQHQTLCKIDWLMLHPGAEQLLKGNSGTFWNIGVIANAWVFQLSIVYRQFCLW